MYQMRRLRVLLHPDSLHCDVERQPDGLARVMRCSKEIEGERLKKHGSAQNKNHAC